MVAPVSCMMALSPHAHGGQVALHVGAQVGFPPVAEMPTASGCTQRIGETTAQPKLFEVLHRLAACAGFLHGERCQFQNAHPARQALCHLAHQGWLGRAQDDKAPHAVAVGIHCTAQRIEQHRQALGLVQHQALALTGTKLKQGVFGKKGAGGRVFEIKIGVNTESTRRETGGPGDSGVRTQAGVHTLQFKTNSLKMICI